MQGLHAAVGDEKRDGFCDACFSGNYLTELASVPGAERSGAPALHAVK